MGVRWLVCAAGMLRWQQAGTQGCREGAAGAAVQGCKHTGARAAAKARLARARGCFVNEFWFSVLWLESC